MVEPGQTIGSYRILRKLGEGGMGAVFEGVHDAIERHVAIKVLHPEYAQRPDMAARFFNEARAVNRIGHPGLVQISDFGQLPDKTAYIVMEFLQGDSLGARLKQRAGALALEEVLNLGCQLAESLAAAHEKGIIHRDLKPDNVMVVADSQMPGGERTKLLDFGIAKLAEEAGPVDVKTRTNAMMGTVYYMSPEQCRGAGKVDDRADVYSFGVMMYEMLSGVRPFTGEGHGEIVVKQMMEEPPPLLEKAPNVPESVAALVHAMLIKDKAKRPAMADVAAELDSFRELAPSPLPRRASASMPITRGARPSGALRPVASATATIAGQSASIRLSKRWMGIATGGLLLLSAAMTFGYFKLQKMQQVGPPVTPAVPAMQQPVAAPPPEVKPPVAAADPAKLEKAVAPVEPTPVKRGKGGKRGKGVVPPAGKGPEHKPAAAPAKPAAPKSKREIEE